MKKGSLKNIIKLVKTDKRYWVILVIFLLIMVFGSKVPSLPNQVTCLNSNDNEKKVAHSLEIGQMSYIIKDSLNSRSGDYYRLNLNLRSEKDESLGIYSAASADKVGIKVNLISINGEKRNIKNLEIPNESKYYSYEIIFSTDDVYTDLEIERANIDSIGKLTIDPNIRITRLYIKNDNQINSLKETVIGENDSVTITANYNPKESIALFNYSSKNSLAGQVFKAQGDAITTASFKMHFLGNGGFGKYHVVLKEAEYINGKYSINQGEISYFDFDATDAMNNYLINPRNEIYQFPLTGKLEKGKYYFVGIDNKKVDTNYFHQLQLFGSAGKDQFQGGISLKGGENIKELGTFYIDINGFNSDEILPGAVVEDLGGGLGSYKYHFEPKKYGFSEASEIITENRSDSKMYYNNSNQAIFISADNDMSIIYEFNTLYRYSKISIKAQQVRGDYYGTKLEYSIDGKNWSILEKKSNINQTDIFGLLLQGNGYQNTVFLRLSANKDNKNDKLNKYFGLGELEVNAELIIQ